MSYMRHLPLKKNGGHAPFSLRLLALGLMLFAMLAVGQMIAPGEVAHAQSPTPDPDQVYIGGGCPSWGNPATNAQYDTAHNIIEGGTDTLYIAENERGCFEISLLTAPTHDVTVTTTLTAGSSHASVTSGSSLTFATSAYTGVQAYQVDRYVVMRGTEDTDTDELDTVTAQFAFASSDPAYGGLTITRPVRIVDNDSDITVTFAESGPVVLTETNDIVILNLTSSRRTFEKFQTGFHILGSRIEKFVANFVADNDSSNDPENEDALVLAEPFRVGTNTSRIILYPTDDGFVEETVILHIRPAVMDNDPDDGVDTLSSKIREDTSALRSFTHEDDDVLGVALINRRPGTYPVSGNNIRVENGQLVYDNPTSITVVDGETYRIYVTHARDFSVEVGAIYNNQALNLGTISDSATASEFILPGDPSLYSRIVFYVESGFQKKPANWVSGANIQVLPDNNRLTASVPLVLSQSAGALSQSGDIVWQTNNLPPIAPHIIYGVLPPTEPAPTPVKPPPATTPVTPPAPAPTPVSAPPAADDSDSGGDDSDSAVDDSDDSGDDSDGTPPAPTPVSAPPAADDSDSGGDDSDSAVDDGDDSDSAVDDGEGGGGDDGTVDAEAASDETDIEFVASAGAYHLCWLDGEGEIACDGYDEDNQVSDAPDTDGFTAISVGLSHSCALDEDGAVHCWGSDEHEQVSDAPDGDGFTSLLSGFNYTCAWHPDDGIVCWGRFAPIGVDEDEGEAEEEAEAAAESEDTESDEGEAEEESGEGEGETEEESEGDESE